MHQGLHKNEPNYQYACCMESCKFQFRNCNAFKCHVYRHHWRSSTVSQSHTLQSPFLCQLPHCQKQLMDLKDLLCHLKSHISRREVVNCPFKDCDKTFSVTSSFTAHLASSCWKHKNLTALHVSSSYCPASVPSESQSSVAESRADEGSVDDEPEADVPDLSQMKSLYMRNMCMFYMKLQAKQLIPSSTIQLIVEELNGLNGMCL